MTGGLCLVLGALVVAGACTWVIRAFDHLTRRYEGWPTLVARIESMGRGPVEVPGLGSALATQQGTLVTYSYPHPATGETLRGTDAFLGRSGTLGPGDPVTIAYDPADPARSHSVLEHARTLRQVLLGGIVVAGILGVVGLVTTARAVLATVL